MNSPDDMQIPDPHFGTDEEMLEWCADNQLTPMKDEDGHWDWLAVWEIYNSRPEEEEKP